MFGGLLFSLCTLNFLDVIFKESNVPLQIVNQVLIPLYDFLLACYRVILDDTTLLDATGRWYAATEYLSDTCYAIDVMFLLFGLSQQHLCLLILIQPTII